MIEFLMLIGMALLITLVMVAGFWVGFKIVDIATGGGISEILK